jgi:hypothetical protein
MYIYIRMYIYIYIYIYVIYNTGLTKEGGDLITQISTNPDLTPNSNPNCNHPNPNHNI